MASTSNRPDSIVTLNEALVGMSPHRRVHPMGVMTTSYLTDVRNITKIPLISPNFSYLS